MTPHLTVHLKAPARATTDGRAPRAKPRGVLNKLAWIFGFEASGASEVQRSAQVGIRPMTADDTERLHEFVQEISPRTSYLRLHSMRTPTRADIHRWANTDGVE